MKKFLISFIAAFTLLLTHNANAQTEVTVTDVPFWFNTEVDIHGGAVWPMQLKTMKPNESFQDLGFSVGLGLTKFWAPKFGTRFNLNYMNASMDSAYDKINKVHFINPSVDFILPVTKLNHEGFKFDVFAGAGYSVGFHRLKSDETNKLYHRHTPTVNAGFDIGLNLFNWTSIALRPEVIFGDFFSANTEQSIEFMPKLTVVLSWRNPDTELFGFEKARLYDYKEVSDLNDQINQLKADQETLRSKYDELIKQKPETVTVTKTVFETPEPSFILFEIGSAEINDEMKPVLESFVNYMKNTEEKTKLELTGYADKNTGSRSFNKQLAEARANTVADYLKMKGVNTDRLIVKFVGSDVQHFTVNSWNRTVLIQTVR